MTFMLASVVDPREAETAVRYGADIVDVKDVRTAFGSVGPSLVRTIVDVLGAHQPISAVIGEPEMEACERDRRHRRVSLVDQREEDEPHTRDKIDMGMKMSVLKVLVDAHPDAERHGQ